MSDIGTKTLVFEHLVRIDSLRLELTTQGLRRYNEYMSLPNPPAFIPNCQAPTNLELVGVFERSD